MDLPRLALLNRLSLSLSAERRGFLYLIQDQSSGKIFTVKRQIAAALLKARALTARPSERPADALSEDETRNVLGFLHMAGTLRQNALVTGKPFNPVFMSFELFDAGRYQGRLEGAARLLVRPAFIVGLLALAALCFLLGTRNGWAIWQALDSVFSLQAILTFGLIAPVLKIIHEFGHVLTATRLGVRVRGAGINLIGFYPMPFVDCTEADVSASRRQRILISLAGIIVDVTIGLTAFIAWHLVQGDYLRTFLGNVFLFSTLNSILFNANPLIKLDGYFVFADLLSLRNLYTRADQTLRAAVSWVFTLGKAGEPPRAKSAWLLSLYAVAAFVYRLHMMVVIALALVPKYLGVGAAAMAWGGYVMFAAPYFRDSGGMKAEKRPDHHQIARRKRLVHGGLIAALALIAFLPRPYRLVLPVQLDIGSVYQSTARTSGFLATAPVTGRIDPGQTVLVLENPATLNEEELLRARLAEAQAALSTVQGASPAETRAALEQVGGLQEQIALAACERTALRHLAPEAGVQIGYSSFKPGQFINAGDVFGAFYPDTGPARLSGLFPERYVTKFQNGATAAVLRMGGHYTDLDPRAISLQAVLSFDRESGTRSYLVKTDLEAAPSSLIGVPGDLKLVFAAEPLLRHGLFWFDGLIANLREAELMERETRLGDKS